MDYTEIEIKIIKQKAYDKGKVEGSLFTLLIVIIALIIVTNQ